MFSKTTDRGVTWSNGRAIFDPGEKNQTIGNQIVVPTAGPAKGVLIDGFDLILTKGGKGNNQRQALTVAVIRSTDGGATWSQPIIVAPQVFAGVSIAGHAVRSERRAARVRRRTERQRLRGLAGRALQRERHLEGRVLTVDRRRPDLVDADPRRPVAGRHSGVHAAGPRRLRRHGRRQLLRPRERDSRAARPDRHVHRALSRRLHDPSELGGRWRDQAQHERARST